MALLDVKKSPFIVSSEGSSCPLIVGATRVFGGDQVCHRIAFLPLVFSVLHWKLQLDSLLVVGISTSVFIVLISNFWS